MEDFRNNLIEAKEITKRCRNREEIKRHLVSLSLIGIILLTLEFHQQRSSYLGLPIDSLICRRKKIEKNLVHTVFCSC